MFPLRIALRYLFSKKSTNAVNLISAIAGTGVFVGSAAFIIILSGLNGFEQLIGNLFGTFNPDLKVQTEKGKVFIPDSSKLATLRAMPEVEVVSETLEEIALFAYNDAQSLGILKGVDQYFVKSTSLDSAIKVGRYAIQSDERSLAIMGVGIADKLFVTFDERIPEAAAEPLLVYMARRGDKGGGLGQPFKSRPLYPAGTFEILQDFNNHIITNLGFARELLSYHDGEVGALEIKLKPGVKPAVFQKKVLELFGPGVTVKDRYQQDDTFYKVTNMERWATFAILCFAYLIVAFNMVGALYMLVMEKRRDVAMLKALGASDALVLRIFLLAGALLSTIGALAGFVVAGLLCKAQQWFGFIPLQSEGSGAFIVDSYPVSLHWLDFVLVYITILIIGLLASWFPASRAAKLGNLGAVINSQ